MKITTVLPTIVVSMTLLSVALTACASPAAAPALPLEGTYWTLNSYADSLGGSQSLLPSTSIDALFKDGSVSGSDSCNQYSAAYQLDGDIISIQPGITTLMACPEPMMDQAQGYMAALASANRYKITGDTLELIDQSGKTVLTYKAGETDLADTNWAAISYNNGKEAVVSLLGGSEITAEFGEDGTLSGSAGCNGYKASYIVDGDTLQIGPPASTRKICSEPEGVMEQEAAYLAAIQAAATFERRGDTLTLRDANGSTLAQFVQN
jgi:heat shock protein HslJ